MTRNLLNAHINQLTRLKSSTSKLDDETKQMRNKTAELRRKVRNWEAAANFLRNKTDNVETANNQIEIHISSLEDKTTALEASTSTLFNRTANLLLLTDFTNRLVETLQAQTNTNDNNTIEALSRKYRLHLLFPLRRIPLNWDCLVHRKIKYFYDSHVFTKMMV